MTEENVPHPTIVGPDEWNARRAELLVAEKALTREYDRVAALRRRLPMIRLEKDYIFGTANGPVRMHELFEGRRQLIMYHFMFGPQDVVGCPVCTGYMAGLGDLSRLARRDTTFCIVGRAPIERIQEHARSTGIRFPFHSSLGSDFNFDLGVSDERGEGQGVSVFFRLGEEVYLAYTTRQRGVELLAGDTAFLDITPYGRQEDFEDSPPGWPQHPTYG